MKFRLLGILFLLNSVSCASNAALSAPTMTTSPSQTIESRVPTTLQVDPANAKTTAHLPAAGPALATKTPAATSGSGAPSSTLFPRPSFSPITLVGTRIITRADQGQTLHLAVGQTFTLRLGGDMAWNVQITDPRVVARDYNATPGPGEQGLYRALAVGFTEFVAVAMPPCAKEQPPCQVMAPAFRLLIIVS